MRFRELKWDLRLLWYGLRVNRNSWELIERTAGWTWATEVLDLDLWLLRVAGVLEESLNGS